MTADLRFSEAYARVIGEKCADTGIGTLGEKAIHKTLKLYYEPDESKHEIEVLGSVADVLSENGIIEVQSSNFKYLVPKLEKFLPQYPVTVVYPIVARTSIRYLDKETGQVSPPRRSPRIKTVHDSARELSAISGFISDKNLTVKIVFLECEEYRLKREGKGSRKDRIDRIPIGIRSELSLKGKEDYSVFLPDSLGESFLAKDYYKAIKSRSRYNYYCLKLLTDLGVIARSGKDGRAFVYTRMNSQ